MRKLFALIILAGIWFSCKKSSTPDSPLSETDSTGVVLSFFWEQFSGNRVYSQTLKYDNDGNLIELSSKDERIEPYELMREIIFTFSYVPSTKLISTYRLRGGGYGPAGDSFYEDTLFYDSQNRVEIDSNFNANGIPEQGVAYRYTYFDQLVVRKSEGTVGTIDSMFLNNRNVIWKTSYNFNGPDIWLNNSDSIPHYSNYRNPFHNENIPEAVRIFLDFTCFNDWVSKDMDWWYEKMVWTTDTKGRVVLGVGDLGSKVTIVYQ